MDVACKLLATLGSSDDQRKDSFDVAVDGAIGKMKGQGGGMWKLGCKLGTRSHGGKTYFVALRCHFVAFLKCIKKLLFCSNMLLLFTICCLGFLDR